MQSWSLVSSLTLVSFLRERSVSSSTSKLGFLRPVVISSSSGVVAGSSSDEEGEEEQQQLGRVESCSGGVEAEVVAMDSSELEYKCVGLMGISVSAWWCGFWLKMESLWEGMRFGVEGIKVCTRLLLGGCGGGVWVVWHHLRMADLRARLGMRVEKSGVVPSGSWGVKFRFLQASTAARSKEWPEETMTGSDMRERERGQRNSSGGVLVLDFVWKKIFFHFSLVAIGCGCGDSFGVILGDGHFLS